MPLPPKSPDLHPRQSPPNRPVPHRQVRRCSGKAHSRARTAAAAALARSLDRARSLWRWRRWWPSGMPLVTRLSCAARCTRAHARVINAHRARHHRFPSVRPVLRPVPVDLILSDSWLSDPFTRVSFRPTRVSFRAGRGDCSRPVRVTRRSLSRQDLSAAPWLPSADADALLLANDAVLPDEGAADFSCISNKDVTVSYSSAWLPCCSTKLACSACITCDWLMIACSRSASICARCDCT